VHAGRHGEGGLEVGDQALAGHERLDLRAERADVLLRRGPEDGAVLLVGQAQHEEGVELAEQLVVEQLRLLRDGAEAHLELPPLPGHPGEDVRLAVGRAGQNPLRLLQHDGHGRQPLVPLGVLEVGAGPPLEHPPGEEGGDEHLLGRLEPADVDEDDLARLEVAEDGPAHRHGRVGADAREVDDAAGPAVEHLEGVEGHPSAQLDVPEPRQVVDGGEGDQPRQAGAGAPAVVALELEQGLLLGAAPVVGGAEVVDGELAQAEPQPRGVREAAGGVGAERLLRPGVATEVGAVLAVGVDQQQPVAAAGPQHPAGQHLHEVRLAHAGGGEDPDVGGQAVAGDAHLHVDHRLAAAQVADAEVAHAGPEEGDVVGLRRHDAGELCREALGLAEGAVAAVVGRRQVAEAPARGDPVGAPPRLVQRVQAGLAPGVVGQHRARHPFGPAGLPVLGPIGDVDHPEQVAAAGGVVDAHDELAEEEVLLGRGPEHAFEDVLAEQPAPRSRRHARSMRSWRSAKARSRTARGTPLASRSSSNWRRTSARSQPGHAARRSATDRG
jgi:hypothetical protein